ncbi:RagB/SusD family nutrient uptake outer membrane protein [Puia sp. P3]|uniref:RagB/SusD family nutrient uptake outer membrane protein n=1 Tax=Puia sp. P3 TaxID=3423952 RepID=UPI003D66E2F9
MALLARVYLYQRQYDSAIQYSSQVINSGTYSINTSLSNVFQKTSPETILQFATPNGYTDIGATFIPNSQLPNFAFTNDFLINVESGDHRVTFWMGTTLNGGATYYYPFKYKNKSINTTNPEYLVTERLAEQYLIRAEAYANENKITQGISDLNVIRFRAGLQANSAQTSVDLLNALAKERRVELFSEWGHRWFDLKRTAEVNTIMSIIKPNTWSPNDTLYPIPLVEMTANSNLIQNTGY